MRSRVWVTGGAVVALLAALTGCSGGSSDQSHGGGSQAEGGPQAQSRSQAQGGSPAKVVQAAYKTTAAAHSAKIRTKQTMHVNGQSMTMNGDGVADFDKKQSRLQMGLPKGLGKMEVRVVDGHAYEKLPTQAGKQGGPSKPWISFDVNSATKKSLGASMGQLTQNAPKDPSAQLGYLRGVSDKGVHKVGTETVHGVKATRYKTDISWDKALPNAKEAAQRMKKLTGSATMPINVWLDKQGRVAQMKVTQKIDPSAAMGGGKSAKTGPVTTQMTQSFSDWGTPVHVTAPPKNQTTEAGSQLPGKRPGNNEGKGGGH